MSKGIMTSGNESSVTQFILLGLTQQPELQLPLFFLFLGIYVVTVVGNLGLIAMIGLNPHLHTPMYYFLFNLSFIDLCYSCVIIPRMLLSCTSTYINELVAFIVVGINETVPSLTLFVSYTQILSNILHNHSTHGRFKAFSIYISHVIAVCLFGSAAFMFLKSSCAESLPQEKESPIFYTIVGPMMNPFIYSLKNKDAQVALRL